MRFLIGTAIGVFVCTSLVLIFALPAGVDLVQIYQNKLQIPLFTGFLTVGGFLLSLKTFILIKLREDLYDLPAYETRLRQKQLQNNSLTKYGPLKRLGDFLVYSVAAAMLTATSQLTLGFVSNRIASALCLASAMMTIVMVLSAWWLIRENLRYWFELLEHDYNSKRDKTADK